MAPRPLPCPTPSERYDQRDTVFSRTRLRPGSPEYEAYYARHPERRSGDDRTRSLRSLATPGGQRFRGLEAALVEALFSASELLSDGVEAADSSAGPGYSSSLGPVPELPDEGWPRLDIAADPAAVAESIRALARFMGADDVGIATLDPGFVYSHRGRHGPAYGQPLHLDPRSAIVLVFAMREPWLGTSPELSATAETARVYQQSGAACYALARLLGRLGIDARAHVDANYLVICPPLAVRAGLGELGRNGVLVHPRLGPGVRLGVVTTAAELPAGEPGCWGVAEFCRSCRKCAEHCPASAIPTGEPEAVRGALRWPLDPGRCYHYWRSQGSDCGVCVRSCPFAKPDSGLHRLARSVIQRTKALNGLLRRLDDLVYGHAASLREFPTPPYRGPDGA